MLKRTVSLIVVAAILLCSMSVGILHAFAETSANDLDAEFEAYLTAEGFPESYKPMLRELHKIYPNWTFKALKVNIKWNAVVEAEYILGDSLIDKTTTSSWKSYDQGRYDFTSSKFAVFDGGAYHAASKEYLAYCMDPRNFLTETSSLMFFVARGQTGETVDGINKILSGLNWAQNYPGTDEVVYIYEDGTYDIIINSAPPAVDDEEEEEEQTVIGVIKGNSVRVRQNASTSADSTVLCQLNSGTEVTVLGEENGAEVSGSTKWYKIKYGDIVGYVHSSLITVSAAVSVVENTSSESTSSEEVTSESTSSNSTSSESTSSDNTSSESTSSDNVSSDITSSDSTSSEGTSSDGTSSDGTSSDDTSSDDTPVFVPTKPVKEKIEINSYAEAFYAAYKLTGISAYMMAARIRQEQGLHGNPSGMGLVSGYEGYYNLWNRNCAGDNKYVVAAQHAKAEGWDTPLKSIMGGSKWLVETYFEAGQDSLYLQKYDVVDGGNGYYWHEYMTYLPAPWQEAKILKMAFTEQTLQNEAVLKIPVYLDMPEQACPSPNATGTNNNYLKSISIAGTAISNFYVYTQNYTDIVIEYSEKVLVEATPYDNGATVSGVGELELAEGLNELEILVTASNGIKRTYKVNVFMGAKPPEPEPEPEPGPEEPDPDNPNPENPNPDEDTPPEEPPTPSIDTTVYTLDTYLTGVSPETTVETFVTNLAVSEGTVKLFGADGAEKAIDTVVATGDKVVIYNNNQEEYLVVHIVIFGDVNADGKITSVDILLARRKILEMSELNEYQAVAANVNKDTNLTSVDLLYIRRYLLGYIENLQGE